MPMLPFSELPFHSASEQQDRSPKGLRAIAKRIKERSGSGFCVPGFAAQLYAEYMGGVSA